MDPLTAIGLASNILSFIDIGSRLATAANEVYCSGGGATTEVLNAKVTNTDLLGLTESLGPLAQTTSITLQGHDHRLEQLRIKCHAVAEQLREKLQSVSLIDIEHPSAWKSFGIAIKSMWSRKDIADFQRQLCKFTEEIQLHILVDLRQVTITGAQNLDLAQQSRFDALDQSLKITTRSIQTRLAGLRTLIEGQGAEIRALHLDTLNTVQTSTNQILGGMGKESDAIKASVADSEAVILDKIQQLSLRRQETFKPLLVDPKFACGPKHFIPRTMYINQLSEKFTSQGQVLLVGIGGVGKSQIAIDYARKMRKDDPSLSLLWVYGNTQSTFVDSYRKILAHIPKDYREDQMNIIRKAAGNNDNGYSDEEVLVLVCDWFSSRKAGRWLMVLDNADSPSLFRIMIGNVHVKASIPQSNLGSLLITSRTQQVSHELMDEWQDSTIQVRQMTPEEAVRMFRAFLQNDSSTDDQVLELARKLDFLPLAIRQASSFIASSGARTTLAKYSQLFESAKYQSRLLRTEFADSTRPEGITNSVVVTWQISFREIERERPLAAEMLAFMGVLSRESIPIYLLRAIQPDELDFELDIGLLIQYSLVDQDTGKDLLSLHRLVQLTIKLWLADSQMQARWYEKAFAVLKVEFARAMSTDDPDRRDIAACRALRIHVLEVCRNGSDTAIGKEECQQLLASVKELDQLGLMWLEAGNVDKVHDATRPKGTVNTGQNLFRHPLYQQWSSSSANQLLWLRGRPGSGKSVLSWYVIDHFKHLESASPSGYKLLVFYFQFHAESSAESVFRELLRQSCTGDDYVPSVVVDMIAKYESSGQSPSMTELLNVFRSVVEQSEREFIVVLDALDECSILSRDGLLHALNRLLQAKITNLRLFITSRHIPDITGILSEDALCVNIDDILFHERNEEIHQYIAECVSTLSNRLSDDEQAKVIQGLYDKSGGVFIYVKTLFECLKRSALSGQYLVRLLESLPLSLHAIYDLSFRQLRESGHRADHLVNSLFMWILYTKRNLSVDELVQAVGAAKEIQSCNAENKQTYLADAGGPFIQFADGSVYLVHYSMKQFFQSLPDDFGLSLDPYDANYSMTTQCLDMLLSNTSTTLSEATLTDRPLLRYAAQYWYTHLSECRGRDSSNRALAQCAQLFDPEKPTAFVNWLRIHDPEHPARGLRLDATIADFSPQATYLSLCGLRMTDAGMEFIGKESLEAGKDNG